MNEPMPYGEAVQELTYLRAQYEQFIIDCERERIIKLLEERFAENVDHCEWGTHLFLDNAIELIKGENK